MRILLGILLLLFISHSNLSLGQNVVAWGDNTFGQTDVPASATNVVAIAAGHNHTVALRADGSLVVWGAITNPPVMATNITAIASGGGHAVALRVRPTENILFTWGLNNRGQLGGGHLTGVTGIAAGDYHTVALMMNGTVTAWGKGYPTYPAEVPGNLSNVVSVLAGAEHTIAVKENGFRVVWGGRTFPWWEATGTMPKFSPEVIAVLPRATNNYALLVDGTIQCWGIRLQPAVPLAATNIVTLGTSSNCTLAVRQDGTILAWGEGAATDVPASATNVINVAAGLNHGVAIVNNGKPHFHGAVAFRAVTSAYEKLPLAVRVSGQQPLQIQWLANGIVLDDITNARPQLVAAPDMGTVDFQVIASNSVACVTSAVARVAVTPVRIWGDWIHRQNLPPPALTNAVAITAGSAHGLALKPDGRVVAWGKNHHGQTNIPAAATNIIAIAAGADHCLAVKSNGTVVAWGRNWENQTNVPASATNVVAIDGGYGHSVALRGDGTVVAWGANSVGETNVPATLSDVIAIAAGYYHNLALKADGRVVAWGNNMDYSVPKAATNILAIAAGWEHNLALRENGTILAWGDNSYGQSDVPASASNVIAIAAGYYHSSALRVDGTVISWGRGRPFMLTNTPAGLVNVCSIAAGEDFAIALCKTGPPVFAKSSAMVQTRLGDNTLLVANATGAMPMAGQWFHNGSAIEGATNFFLRITGVQASDGGTYTYVVSNSAGENSFTAELTVNHSPYVERLPDRSVPPWTEFSVTASVYGLEPMEFQWIMNGTTLVNGGRFSGTSGRTLQLNTAEPGDSGFLQLVASNAFGIVTGTVCQVRVTPIVGWGDNVLGQLDAPGGESDIVAISARGDHSLALTARGTVLAWGDNAWSQNNVPTGATNVMAISDGWDYSLALRSNNTVVAWGYSFLTNVPASATNITAISAGYPAMAVRKTSELFAWGGYLAPASNVVAVGSGLSKSLALYNGGTLVSNYTMATLPLSSNLTTIASGGKIRLGLTTSGTVVGATGTPGTPLEVPSFVTNVTQIAVGWDHALALRADGTVVAWGTNDFRQSEVPPFPYDFTAIAAGDAHSLALARVSTNLHIHQQPRDQVVAQGQSAHFSVVASGRGPLTYQWHFNNTPVADATNALFTFTAGSTSTGLYSAVIANPWGSITSSVAALNLAIFRLGLEVSSGNPVLALDAPAGAYTVQYSEDLLSSDWMDLITFTNLSPAPYTFVDTNTLSTTRFYRAIASD